MQSKKTARIRRAKSTRKRILEKGAYRLSVYRSSTHIYAQVLSPVDNKIIAQASTLETELRAGNTGNINAAGKVGALVATRAMEAGVESVAFDRSGYKYHGRVKALADAARQAGLQF
jgi:large subunit ribosomal protein L18